MSQQSPFGPPGGGFGPPAGSPPGGGFGPPAGSPPGGGFGLPAGSPPGGGFGIPQAAPPPNYVAATPGAVLSTATTDPLAIGSFVVGLLSLPTSFCCSFFAIPMSIIAVVVGVMSLSKINKEPHLYSGRPLAICGIVLGGLGIALLLVFVLLGMGSAILNQVH